MSNKLTIDSVGNV
jgi:hypothetical protein